MVEELIHAVEEAQGRVSQVEAERTNIEGKLDFLNSRSRTSGYITEVYPAKGEFLEVGTRILRLISENRYVRFAFPASKNIKIGDIVELTHIGNTEIQQSKTVRVRNISPTPDMASMLLVETTSLGHDNKYRSGDLCRLRKH